jgi:hypothetical protein
MPNLSPEERAAKIFDPEFHAPLKVPALVAETGALPSAVRECQWIVSNNPKDWVVDIEGVLVNIPTGLSAAEWVERQKKDRPHWWPTGEQADLQLAAFGDADEGVNRGSLEARGKLMKEFGTSGYRTIMAAWGCTEGSLAPGKRPATAEDGTLKKAESAKSPSSAGFNPFNPKYTSPDKHERIAALIKKVGTKAASAMARGVGADLAGRPLR